MAQDHKGGDRTYESGGGAYEFPPLEKQGKSAQYRAASEYRTAAPPPPGYTPVPGPVPGYPHIPASPPGHPSFAAPTSGYPPGSVQPNQFRQAQPGYVQRPPVVGNRYSDPGVKVVRIIPFVVVAAVAYFVFWPFVDVGDDRSSMIEATSTTRVASTGSAAPTTPKASTPTTQSSAVIAAVLPGYQGVAVASRGIAYDVPVGWTVDSPSVIRGFEGETGRISGTGTAVDGEDYCGENNRALAFVSRAQDTDHAATATEFGASTAEIAYDSSGWTRRVTGPEPLTTRSGITGWMVETSGNQTPDPAECSTEYSIYTFVFAGTDTSGLILTLAAERGVHGEVTPEQAREIFSTVRFHG